MRTISYRILWGSTAVLLSLAPRLLPPAPVFAAERPSLFRGVVVADSPLGVRVVSVEESSQAHLADLRPEDIIVRVQDHEIRSIDEFAVMSSALKGQTVSATVLIFRNGTPRELTLHLYSVPVLQVWGLAFVPEHDLRFADPRVGLAYWRRLGRGFEDAGKLPEALNAYLNGLHNVPDDAETALQVSGLLSQESQRALADGALAAGIAKLRESLHILGKLFGDPLSDEQLDTVRHQLASTLKALREVTKHPPAPTPATQNPSST